MTVQRKKNQHRVRADALVAVNKRMILYKPETEPRSFFQNGRVKIFAVKTLKRVEDRGIEQPFVTYPVRSARFFLSVVRAAE